MDTLVNILTVLIIVTAVILALLVSVLVIRYINMRKRTEALLKRQKRDERLVYELLRIYYPKSRIIKKAVLPETLPNGALRNAYADIILVDCAGVFVIRIKNLNGIIDNPKNGTWTAANKSGVSEFCNPFADNIGAVHAVTEILKREKIYNVPRHSIVVFTGRKLMFKNRYKDLLPTERLIDTLRDYNRERFLNQTEINQTASAIRSCLAKNVNKPSE